MACNGMSPAFAARINPFIAASGGRVACGGCLRTRAQQVELKRRKPSLAAAPGKSNHEDINGTGGAEACDLVYKANGQQWAHQYAASFGLRFPMSYEPWHIERNDLKRNPGSSVPPHDPNEPGANPSLAGQFMADALEGFRRTTLKILKLGGGVVAVGAGIWIAKREL